MTKDKLYDLGYKAFWTAVAAALAWASTQTLDVGPEWTPVATTVYTGLLVAARQWVDKRLNPG